MSKRQSDKTLAHVLQNMIYQHDVFSSRVSSTVLVAGNSCAFPSHSTGRNQQQLGGLGWSIGDSQLLSVAELFGDNIKHDSIDPQDVARFLDFFFLL